MLCKINLESLKVFSNSSKTLGKTDLPRVSCKLVITILKKHCIEKTLIGNLGIFLYDSSCNFK